MPSPTLREVLISAGVVTPAADGAIVTPVRLAPGAAVVRLDLAGRKAAAGRVALARAGQWDRSLDMEPGREIRFGRHG